MCECPQCRPLLWRRCFQCARPYKVYPGITHDCKEGFIEHWAKIECSNEHKTDVERSKSLVDLA